MIKNKIVNLMRESKIRYLLIGGSSAAIEYAIFILLDNFVANVIVANAISFSIGLVYSFILHRAWTFSGSHNYSAKSQFIAYGTLAVINVCITSALMDFQVNHLSVPPFIAKLFCMSMVVVWNYLLLNRIIFAKVK